MFPVDGQRGESAFNDMRDATLFFFTAMPPFAGLGTLFLRFLIRFRQRQGRIRPRKG
jgi:hypothetical protein